MENLTDGERELLEAFLRALRREDGVGGSKKRQITYSDILRTLERHAFMLEDHAQRYGVGHSEEADVIDAAANLIQAICCEMPDIKPLLQGFGKKARAARYGVRK